MAEPLTSADVREATQRAVLAAARGGDARPWRDCLDHTTVVLAPQPLAGERIRVYFDPKLSYWVVLMTPATWDQVRRAFLDLDWPFGSAALYREAAAICAYLAEVRAVPAGKPS